MKTYSLIKKSLVITFASIILACGAETLVALVFIPAFAATWPVEGEDFHSINLDPNEDNRNVQSGVFTGEEFDYPEDTDFLDNNLTGSFNGLNIEFTIDRLDDGIITYTGIMIPISNEDHNIIRIELISSEGEELVLGSE